MSRLKQYPAINGKTQADGDFEIDTSGSPYGNHQIEVDLGGAVAATGTLYIDIKQPGGSGSWRNIGSFDLTSTTLVKSFNCAAEAIQIRPVGFDAEKSYNVYLFTAES
jgi:hypothetical protein